MRGGGGGGGGLISAEGDNICYQSASGGTNSAPTPALLQYVQIAKLRGGGGGGGDPKPKPPLVLPCPGSHRPWSLQT